MERSHAGQPRAERLRLLGVYLNDHLGGATFGTDLARRLANLPHEPGTAESLRRLAAEIAEDRAHLLDIMKRLDVPVHRHKVVAGWVGEKASRLKTNGRLVRRSPLSLLLELEMLRLGVEGKAAGWRTLREAAETEPNLSKGLLDDLLERAERQRDLLEKLRVEQAAHVFVSDRATERA
ncbi:hypothetical protein [Streptomyces sp. RPT161]|uniref:hypothetical protein n=1 Tax=Streptomyces sp. RPT161 TaxID=3015993 RepID=UPI0022B9376F|nr:hypothetical protein [Streptomyces sp. RPT161]